MASSLVKIIGFSAAMSATAWAGIEDWYLSRLTYLFNQDRSTHIRISLVSFFWSNDEPLCGLGDWGDDALALE